MKRYGRIMTDDTEEKEKYIQIVLTHCSQLMCSSMSLMMKYNMIVRQKKLFSPEKLLSLDSHTVSSSGIYSDACKYCRRKMSAEKCGLTLIFFFVKV